MKNILIIFLIFLSPITVYAEEGVDKATVEELLEVTNVKSIVDTMYFEIDQMLEGLAAQLGISEEEQPIFDKYIAKVNAAVKEQISWEKMKDPMIELYKKHYTQKEIKDILSFYKTDTGKSLVKKMPLVMQDSIQLSQSMFKMTLPKIQEFAEELQVELLQVRSEKQ
jgi:uncharacterized protein